MKYYAGIGSRSSPPEILELMTPVFNLYHQDVRDHLQNFLSSDKEISSDASA